MPSHNLKTLLNAGVGATVTITTTEDKKLIVEPTMLPAAKLLVEQKRDGVANLICSALESGSYATFGIAGYIDPPKIVFQFDKDEVFKHIDYPLNPGGAVWLFNRYDENDPDGEPQHDCGIAPWVMFEARKSKGGMPYFVYKLDLPTVERGFAVFMEKCPKHFGDFMAENDDFYTADSFLQCCIFGEAVYG